MTTPQKFAVGDKVMVTSVNARGQGPQEREVIKVGRVNVTLNGGWYTNRQPKTFNMESGNETGNYTHERVYTLAEYAAKEARGAILERWKASPLREMHSRRFDEISNDTLTAILDLLEPVDALAEADTRVQKIREQVGFSDNDAAWWAVGFERGAKWARGEA